MQEAAIEKLARDTKEEVISTISFQAFSFSQYAPY